MVMSDQGKRNATPLPAVLASTSDLASVDIAATLDGLSYTDSHSLWTALSEAVQKAKAIGDAAAERGYLLLTVICTFPLRVEDDACVWGGVLARAGRTFLHSE